MKSTKSMMLLALLTMTTGVAGEISGSGHQVAGCTGEILSHVWNDANSNGVQDAGEPPIAGVDLTIWRSDSPQDGQDTLTSDATGTVHFFNLCLISHMLLVDTDTLPAGMVPTFVGAPIANAEVLDSDADGNAVRIDLNSHYASEQTIDFGYRRVDCVASIGDYVWLDRDADGVQDATEVGLAGALVTLSDYTGQQVAAAVTTPDGRYRLGSICDGSYQVRVDPGDPALLATQINPGPLGMAAGSTSHTTAILPYFANGSDDRNVDVGFNNPDCGAGFDGRIFIDDNANGELDSDESGLPGATLRALRSGSAPRTTTTDSSGNYRLDELCAGSYDIEIDAATLPDQVAATFDAALLSQQILPNDNARRSIDDMGFAVACNSQIGDFVWNDSDHDGIQDAGELGLAGVSLSLRDARGALVGETTTNNTGEYHFRGLCAGNYALQVNASTVDVELQASPALQGNPSSDSGGTAPVWITVDGFASSEFDNDFGFYAEQCTVAMASSCTPLDEQATAYQCERPVDLLGMTWDGNQPIRVVAHIGKIDTPVLSDVDNIQPGDTHVVPGYRDGDNDVVWEIFAANSDNKLGESHFHLSCSDKQMDGPEDCGARQGDGKDGSRCSENGCVNDWLLDEIVDSKGRLTCGTDDAIVGETCDVLDEGFVTYKHVLRNGGIDAVTGVQLSDAASGEQLAAPDVTLQPGDLVTVRETVWLSQSESRTVSVSATGSGGQCSAAATVEIVREPTPPCRLIGAGSFDLSDDKFKWKLKNTGAQTATISRIDVSWPPGNNRLKEIKLAGDRLSDLQFDGPSASVVNFGGALDKRQLNPNKREDLEIKFTDNNNDATQNDYAVTVHLAEGCAVQFVNSGDAFRCSKPVRELEMEWDGEQEPVTIVGHRGSSSDEAMFKIKNVARGDRITHSGLDESTKEVVWEIFSGNTKIGESLFTLDCDDDDMRAAMDCGRRQGNGKDDKPQWVNDWLLRGMTDDDGPFACPERD